jgi:hypothetical protein
VLCDEKNLELISVIEVQLEQILNPKELVERVSNLISCDFVYRDCPFRVFELFCGAGCNVKRACRVKNLIPADFAFSSQTYFLRLLSVDSLMLTCEKSERKRILKVIRVVDVNIEGIDGNTVVPISKINEILGACNSYANVVRLNILSVTILTVANNIRVVSIPVLVSFEMQVIKV